MSADRLNTITGKTKTAFGNLYCHVAHDDSGRVVEISFSHPGRFDNSAIGDALVALGVTATEIIGEIGGAS